MSMSLEALRAMKNDYDVLERLGKLPRKLAALYKEIYDDFFTHTYEVGQALIKNTFKWLLCISGSLSSHEFLAAITQTVTPAPTTLTREEVLDLCSNFVVYDASLDKFDFAHPSVREFLEILPDYVDTSSHAAAAECCLVYMIGRAGSFTARKFLSEHYSFSETNDRSVRNSFYSHGFGVYAARYGMVHCSAAKTARGCGSLRPAFELFLIDDSDKYSALSWWIKQPMQQAVPEALRSRYLYFRDCLTCGSPSHRAVIMACAFGYSEIIAHYSQSSLPERTREQALVISTLADQDDVVARLLDIEEKFIASRTALQHLLDFHLGRSNSRETVLSILGHCHSDAIDGSMVIKICRRFPSLISICFRQNLLVNSEVVKYLMLEDQSMVVTLLAEKPDLQITQDLVGISLDDTCSRHFSAFVVLMKHDEHAFEGMIGEMATLLGAEMKAEQWLLERPHTFKSVYDQSDFSASFVTSLPPTETRAASQTRQYLWKMTDIFGPRLLEVILDYDQAMSIRTSLQRYMREIEATRNLPTMACYRCYEEALTTLILRRAYKFYAPLCELSLREFMGSFGTYVDQGPYGLSDLRRLETIFIP